MARLTTLKNRDPYIYKTHVKVVSAVNSTSQHVGFGPSPASPAPPQMASLTVPAEYSWFALAITDPTNAQPGHFTL